MPRKQMTPGDWRKTIAEESKRFEEFTGRVRVDVSGGSASAIVWHRCLELFGADRVVPVFADTNSEDADLYRFLDDCETHFGQTLTRLNDGRNIWDVFDQTGIMRIAKAGNACKASIELKQKPLADHFKTSGCDAIAVGIEFQEPERMERFQAKIAAPVLFPLARRPLFSECEIHEEVKRLGLKPPEIYNEGYGHNNCAGRCILAGLGQWAANLRRDPVGFTDAESRETAFVERTGFTILRDQRGSNVKPYTLKELRADAGSGREFPNDWKSTCQCMEPVLFSADNCF